MVGVASRRQIGGILCGGCIYIEVIPRAHGGGGVGVGIEAWPDALRHDDLVAAGGVARPSHPDVRHRSPRTWEPHHIYSIAKKRSADPL